MVKSISGQAKRARRSRVPFHLFLEKEGETRLSVDRLDVKIEQ